MKGYALFMVLAVTFLIGAAYAGQAERPDTAKAVPAGDASARKLDMKAKEILGKNCATSICHGGKNPKMHMNLEADSIPADLIDVPSKQNAALMLIDTKDPSKSYILLKIKGGEGMKGKRMPLMKAPLTEDEHGAVTAWISGFAGTAGKPAKESVKSNGN
jgi:hypothetical protein